MQYTTEIPKLVSRQFDNEIIIANFETGIYYSLINSAADIWLGLQSGASAERIGAAIAGLSNDPEDGERVVAGFVTQLLAENLIAPDHRARPSAGWLPQFSEPFSPPVLERFEDLRDLLFLDPVHDVSDAGWPIRDQGRN